MKSKIVNMAEKAQDPEDIALRALFASEPVADDGFSERVVAQIRRGQRIRRWCLGSAVAIGGAIAFKPMVALIGLAYGAFLDASTGLFAESLAGVPSMGMMAAGGVLFAGLMIALRLLEE